MEEIMKGQEIEVTGWQMMPRRWTIRRPMGCILVMRVAFVTMLISILVGAFTVSPVVAVVAVLVAVGALHICVSGWGTHTDSFLRRLQIKTLCLLK